MSFLQFEIIINVWVSSLRFILILMLLVYGHYKDFTLVLLFSAGIDYGRQNLTSITYVRFRRLKSIPALKETRGWSH